MRVSVDRWVLLSLAILFMPLVTAANAGTAMVVYDATGNTTLAQDGWTLTRNAGDPVEKSKDYSSGQMDGTVGVWNINDNNQPVNAYMKMWKDPAADNTGYPNGGGLGGLDQSQGIIMARIKALAGTNTGGTFGYSMGGSGHSVAVAVRVGALAFKTADGANTTAANVSLDTSSDYRVYAIKYSSGGVFSAWYSLTNDWSPNPSDWVQAVNGATASGAMIDQNGNPVTGLVMGSIGSSGNVSQTNVDWIAWSKYSDYQLPWNFHAPEPASLALLVLGAVPLLRRRR